MSVPRYLLYLATGNPTAYVHIQSCTCITGMCSHLKIAMLRTSWPYYILLSLAQALCMHMESAHMYSTHCTAMCAQWTPGVLIKLAACHTHSLGRCIPMYVYLHTVSITMTDTCTFTYSAVQQYPCIALHPTYMHVHRGAMLARAH